VDTAFASVAGGRSGAVRRLARDTSPAGNPPTRPRKGLHLTDRNRALKIVETDNFDGDYPDEKFLDLPPLQEHHAKKIADEINFAFPSSYPRFWKVVPDSYTLSPGFEP
jgi:hypothetical protein